MPPAVAAAHKRPVAKETAAAMLQVSVALTEVCCCYPFTIHVHTKKDQEDETEGNEETNDEDGEGYCMTDCGEGLCGL